MAWIMVLRVNTDSVHLGVAELAIAALIRCDSVVKKLLERARDGSSSSRLFIQLQVSKSCHVGSIGPRSMSLGIELDLG